MSDNNERAELFVFFLSSIWRSQSYFPNWFNFQPSDLKSSLYWICISYIILKFQFFVSVIVSHFKAILVSILVEKLFSSSLPWMSFLTLFFYGRIRINLTVILAAWLICLWHLKNTQGLATRLFVGSLDSLRQCQTEQTFWMARG